MDTTGESAETSTPDEGESAESEQDTQEGGEAAPAKGEPGAREKRRNDWYQERKREMDDLRQELGRERQARQQREVELAEWRGRVEAARSAQPAEDPYESRLTDLRDKAERHLGAASTAGDKETARKELAAYHRAMEDIADVRAEKHVQQARQEWAQSQPDMATQAVAADLGAEFKWLRNNASARAVADALINDMINEGHPNGYETYRAACAQAAQILKLGGDAPPTNGASKRYSLVPAKHGAGAAGGEQSMGAMQDFQKKIAETMYPDLESDAAHKKWWNEIGKKVAKQG